MPGGDRRGPAGMGPMTGRATGFCAGYPVPGIANAGYGGGWGYGRAGGYGRGGHGWRNQYCATGLTRRQGGGYPYNGGATPNYVPDYPQYATGYFRENELNVLKGQAEYMEDSLAGINKKIKDLEDKGSN